MKIKIKEILFCILRVCSFPQITLYLIYIKSLIQGRRGGQSMCLMGLVGGGGGRFGWRWGGGLAYCSLSIEGKLLICCQQSQIIYIVIVFGSLSVRSWMMHLTKYMTVQQLWAGMIVNHNNQHFYTSAVQLVF